MNGVRRLQHKQLQDEYQNVPLEVPKQLKATYHPPVSQLSTMSQLRNT